MVRALYGNLESGDSVDNNNPESKIIDVTIAVQNLVCNSQLHFHSASKIGLVGFYDCAVGENKKLNIQYSFKNKLHQVTIADEEAMSCPKRSHVI